MYKGKNRTLITLLPHSSCSIPKEGPLLPYLGSLSKDFIFAKGCQTTPSHPKSWVKPCKDWNKWVEKLKLECNILWDQLGISQFIQMTTRHIICQSSLLLAALRFWSPSCNCFVFPFSHMTITLLDIFVITGLPILGDDTVYLIDEYGYIETNISSRTYDTYPKVVSHYLPLTSKPSTEEHIDFL